jgi:hypothetical protein
MKVEMVGLPRRKMPNHHGATRGRRMANVLTRRSISPSSMIGFRMLRVELSQGLTRLHIISDCQKILQITEPRPRGSALKVI